VRVEGQCACGTVKFVAEGEPIVQLICHCPSCQLAHSAPMVFGAQFPANQFSSDGPLTSFTLSASSDATRRMTCTRCGTRVFNGSGIGPRTIFPGLCQHTDWFVPEMHLYWANRKVEIVDELPKYLDFPVEFGGTGQMGE
jgi:hypothetical protein